VEVIATGHCKVYESELSKERYEYYLSLREKVRNIGTHNVVVSI